MSTSLQVIGLVVQVLALAGLIWYVIETMKIRRAAQQQLRTSLDLIKAATDQIEGMSKPCLTLWGELRDGADAILEMNGAVGNIIAAADHGSFVLMNIGNGVALNIRYTFTRDNPPNPRYVPNLMPTGKATLVETIGGYNAEHIATFEYESIGARKYKSTIHLNHRVITAMFFEEVKAVAAGN